jgi:predicted ATPase
MAASPVYIAPSGKRRTIFIPVGMPGSGKTWLYNHLNAHAVRSISQDELKISCDELLNKIDY